MVRPKLLQAKFFIFWIFSVVIRLFRMPGASNEFPSGGAYPVLQSRIKRGWNVKHENGGL